jgi:hypothetical protein
VIRDIEGFGPKLQTPALLDPPVLNNGKIDLNDPWIANIRQNASQVAVCIARWIDKDRRVEPLACGWVTQFGALARRVARLLFAPVITIGTPVCIVTIESNCQPPITASRKPFEMFNDFPLPTGSS